MHNIIYYDVHRRFRLVAITLLHTLHHVQVDHFVVRFRHKGIPKSNTTLLLTTAGQPSRISYSAAAVVLFLKIPPRPQVSNPTD
jgi:hypothetical protein